MISYTGIYLLTADFENPIAFRQLRRSEFSAFVFSSNSAYECFLVFSAFIATYKVSQIYDAKNGLTFVDVLKIYARKFFRYAPVFYAVFFLSWAFISWIGSGPFWNLTSRMYY